MKNRHEQWNRIVADLDQRVPGGIRQLLGAPDWYLELLLECLPTEHLNREVAKLILDRRREPPEQDVIDTFRLTFPKR
jgi:hypothetical protein